MDKCYQHLCIDLTPSPALLHSKHAPINGNISPVTLHWLNVVFDLELWEWGIGTNIICHPAINCKYDSRERVGHTCIIAIHVHPHMHSGMWLSWAIDWSCLCERWYQRGGGSDRLATSFLFYGSLNYSNVSQNANSWNSSIFFIILLQRFEQLYISISKIRMSGVVICTLKL